MIAIGSALAARESALEVVDMSARRADLSRRRETKFAFHQPDLDAIRQVLAGNGRREIYHRPVSVVRSVYFDDLRLSSCRANLDGLSRRHKLRLRWYDSLRPQTECFLEVKWRRNRLTGKHRLRVESREPLGALPYRTILDRLAAAMPEHLLPTLLAYHEPVLLVEYRREHFVSPERRLRVTLDYGIVYYEQLGRQTISTAFGRKHEGFVVLEGKTPVGCESELRLLLHPLTGRVTGCSKYVHGCRICGLIRRYGFL